MDRWLQDSTHIDGDSTPDAGKEQVGDVRDSGATVSIPYTNGWRAFENKAWRCARGKFRRRCVCRECSNPMFAAASFRRVAALRMFGHLLTKPLCASRSLLPRLCRKASLATSMREDFCHVVAHLRPLLWTAMSPSFNQLQRPAARRARCDTFNACCCGHTLWS